MFIWKDMDGPEKKTAGALLLFVLISLLRPFDALACSCAWKGPFLSVAKEAPLVVVGKIARHHPGQSPSMDVLVLETLKGGILDSGMTIQMGDGMHCRPAVETFPVGTRWILAINGPGAKAGKGWAISHCGEYWLRLENNDVVGSIDGERNQVQKIPLERLKSRFLYPRFHENFSGRAVAGKPYSRPFGMRFVFALEPMADGWQISVREYGREENLARLTPPFHFVPNPRDIEGWHLLANPSACVHRPYRADAGPANPRRFIFSPDVGKSVLYGSDAGEAEVKKVESFGRGSLEIEKFSLSDAEDGCPKIEWMDFSVHIEGGY